MSTNRIKPVIIEEIITDSINIKKRILSDKRLLQKISNMAEVITDRVIKGGVVYLAGNGGSASDAQHIAAEFVSKLNFDRPGLSAQSLATDTSILTAVANDYGYENLFSRQLEARARKGDVFIAITTSGQSKNILKAIDYCKDKGIDVLVLCGEREIVNLEADLQINIPSSNTARIQECHILIGHYICGRVELNIFG